MVSIFSFFFFICSYGAIIPNLKTQDALFNGQLYKEIPVMHVLCTMNNTIIALTNAEGMSQHYFASLIEIKVI